MKRTRRLDPKQDRIVNSEAFRAINVLIDQKALELRFALNEFKNHVDRAFAGRAELVPVIMELIANYVHARRLADVEPDEQFLLRVRTAIGLPMGKSPDALSFGDPQAVPCAYRFIVDGFDGHGHDDIRVEWRGDASWAVVRGGFECLNRDGNWEHEPMPSSRTHAFFERCRFPLPDALDRATKFIEAQSSPTPAPSRD